MANTFLSLARRFCAGATFSWVAQLSFFIWRDFLARGTRFYLVRPFLLCNFFSGAHLWTAARSMALKVRACVVEQDVELCCPAIVYFRIYGFSAVLVIGYQSWPF